MHLNGTPWFSVPLFQVQEGIQVLRLRRNDKKVGWSEDTVDNEGMDKKKSKCCCVYRKPMQFGESSSETDDECENCFGHVEVKKKHRLKKKHHGGGGGSGGGESDDESHPDGGDDGKNNGDTHGQGSSSRGSSCSHNHQAGGD